MVATYRAAFREPVLPLISRRAASLTGARRKVPPPRDLLAFTFLTVTRGRQRLRQATSGHAILSVTLTDVDLSLTGRLRHLAGGDRAIADDVLREILPRLRQIAARQLGRERSLPPLTPTELIHESWLRRLRRSNWRINDREHFFCMVAYAMRQILIDFARERSAMMRSAAPADGPDPLRPAMRNVQQIVEIGIAMEELERRDLLAAKIVDLHYIAGFTLNETADTLGLSAKQVRYRWDLTRLWLQGRLSA